MQIQRALGAVAVGVSLAVVSMLALSQSAKADVIIDPFMNEYVINSCPSNCASATLALDPGPGGLTTVMYTFNSTIPIVVAGDVLIAEGPGGSIGDLIRFENIGGVGAVAFIYSSDIGGGFAADVGLPASLQDTVLTISEASNEQAIFTPLSTQPGFCEKPSANGPVACSASVTYGLQSVPEPGTLALLGAGLLALGFLRRRKAA
jgi:hypothetical protein